MLNYTNKKRNQKGFTLMELVVVIAILGILSAIAFPRIVQSRTTAKIATHNSNVRIINTVAGMYVSENPYSRDTTITDNLKEYFDDNILPNIPKGIGFDNEEYKVRIDSNGNIEIEPDKK